MMIFRRACLLPTMLAALALAGCAETELVAYTAKSLNKAPSSAPDGAYKIGQPYQVDGIWYYPKVDYAYNETGIASWYGPGFHGGQTANGERYDQNSLTAAHRTLPLPSIVRVTNLENGRSIKVRINDRGPFSNGRIIDLSRRGADLLGFRQQGTAKVMVEVVEDESRRLASAAITEEAAVSAPQPAPLEPVIIESLSGSPAATLASTPAASQTAAILTPRPVALIRPHMSLPSLDGLVTTVPVRPTNIFVQAGSFTRVDNALRLRARLSQLGNVQVAEAMVESRQYFRVRIGPVASVDEADRLLAMLLGNGHVDARVVVD
jgi:rare lipoprotein A